MPTTVHIPSCAADSIDRPAKALGVSRNAAIAAHALALDATLVTANLDHMPRVPARNLGLKNANGRALGDCLANRLRGHLEVFDLPHLAGQWVPSGENLVHQPSFPASIGRK